MRIATMKIALIALAMIWSTAVAAAQNADAVDQLHELSQELEELNEQSHRHHVELVKIQRILERLQSHKDELEARQARLAEMVDRDPGRDRRRQHDRGERDFDLREMMGEFARMGGVGEIIIERRSSGPDNSHVDRRVIPFDLGELDPEDLERIQDMMDRHIRGGDGSEVEVLVEIMTDDEGDDRWRSRGVEIDRRDVEHSRQREGDRQSHRQWDRDPWDQGEDAIPNRFRGHEMPPVRHPDSFQGHNERDEHPGFGVEMLISELHEARSRGATWPHHAVAAMQVGSPPQMGTSRRNADQEPGDDMLDRLDRMETFAAQLDRGDRMALLGISLTQELLDPEQRIDTLHHMLGNETYTLVSRNAAALVMINAMMELGETDAAQGLLQRLIATNATKAAPTSGHGGE